MQHLERRLRAEDELLTSLRVPAFPDGMSGAYLKFGYHQRPTLGVGVAVRLGDGPRPAVEDLRVALGSVSPRPLRLREVEERLRGQAAADVSGDGKPLFAEAAELAAAAAEPVDDMHGSAEYKRQMTKVFLGKALDQAIASALAHSDGGGR